MMFCIRSGGIVEAVCLTGTVPPFGSSSSERARLAVDVVLADQRLRADLAARVLAERVERRPR